MAQGHQAYFVAPRISVSEYSNAEADLEFLFGEESDEIAAVEELAPSLHSGA